MKLNKKFNDKEKIVKQISNLITEFYKTFNLSERGYLNKQEEILIFSENIWEKMINEVEDFSDTLWGIHAYMNDLLEKDEVIIINWKES
jgi:hypothetical protein